MGCDIHLHVEVKKDGRWIHWARPEIPRYYGLFERMAGVRGDRSEAIAPPRGLPEDISETTRLDRAILNTDGHSDSWLTASEAATIEAEVEAEGEAPTCSHIFGWLFGNCIAGFLMDDVDTGAKAQGVTDVRIVFWFDN